MSGRTLVSVNGVTIQVFQAQNIDVTYPAGKRVFGGGYSVDHDIRVQANGPVSNSTRRVVIYIQTGDTAIHVEAHAICATVSP